jgi:transposase
MPRRRPLPLERLPPDILPPDLLQRHDLVHRLVTAPREGLTPPHPWAPMTDAEWDLLRPHLPGSTGGGPSRPMPDPRARLDAIFRAVTLKRPEEQGGGRAAWAALPEHFGKADTIARLFRRWARQGLWAKLLCLVSDKAAAQGSPLLLALRWRVCCAFRRGIRLMGLRTIVLARRLGVFSALHGPSHRLPDPDLSEIFQGVIRTTLNRLLEAPGWRPPRRVWPIFRGMLRLAGGSARIPRRLEPA